jgi:DNA-binding NtrC family response regulator
MSNTSILADSLKDSPSGSAPWALELIGHSPAIARVHERLRLAVSEEGSVLLVAEHGVGVDAIARELHERRPQPHGPFIAIDCAREGSRVETTLFGGSASGADLETIAPGAQLAAARGGTLFLRDVGELPASVQARLARVLRDSEASVAGSAIPMVFRLVGSATRDIDGDAQARRFRADLYRRLSTLRIDLPALRDRPEDIPVIAARILDDLCATRSLPPRHFTQAASALLAALSWPGNLAELRRVIERVETDATVDQIRIEHLLPALQLDRAPAPFVPAGNLREARLRFERDYIAAVLQHHGWRMAEAAQTLGIQRPNLYRKARQLGIAVTRTSD